MRGALGRQLGIFKRCLELRHLRLLRGEIGLERAALEPIELSPFLISAPSYEQALFQKRGDARDDIDAIDRLDPAEEFAGLGDRPPGRLDDADGGRRSAGPGCVRANSVAGDRRAGLPPQSALIVRRQQGS